MARLISRSGLPAIFSLALALGACGGSSKAPSIDAGRDAAEHQDAAKHPDARDDDGAGGSKDASAKDAGGDDAAADAGDLGGCATGLAGEPTELRCTGLYSDWAAKTVAAANRQYDPGLHLWSDGASKTRWVYLPPGTQIDTSNMDEWQFPKGTKIWKEFALGGTRIETRLIWKQPSGSWYLTTYRWSADGTTSTQELTGGATNVAGTSYEIPAQTHCYDCHGGRADIALGFEAVALSSPQASGVTMATLTAEDRLTAPPAKPLTIPGDAATAAALGYLHMNCGTSCHNRDTGEAGSSSLFMRLDVATLASPQTTDAYTTGVGANAYFSIPGVAQPLVFAPCSAGSSSAYYRMDHRDGVDGGLGGTQMPPIITHQVDTAGMAQIAAWLNGFPQCGAADAGRD